MNIKDIKQGQMVKFITKVDKSSKGEEIQEVLLRVTEITDNHVRGVNVNRVLDGTQDTPPFRTYKIANIVGNTVWLKLDD
jgi:hypothetical protein